MHGPLCRLRASLIRTISASSPVLRPARSIKSSYTTRGSSIVGLGFAAVRDIVSFLKYASRDKTGIPVPVCSTMPMQFGASQSGSISAAADPSWPQRGARLGAWRGRHHPAHRRGMRGEFNLRFGQPSRMSATSYQNSSRLLTRPKLIL